MWCTGWPVFKACCLPHGPVKEAPAGAGLGGAGYVGKYVHLHGPHAWPACCVERRNMAWLL